jgi:hypothetical protein
MDGIEFISIPHTVCSSSAISRSLASKRVLPKAAAAACE